jgi:tetratricopeptide (TPR) repeat protein
MSGHGHGRISVNLRAFGGALFCTLLCTLVLSTAIEAAESFDPLLQQIARAGATSTEASVADLLKAALEEQKEHQAHAAAQGWFRQNVAKDPDTVRLAAEVAERSAHYPAAVALYQQYVAKVDPKSKDSQHAVMRMYRLMIDVMQNQGNAAYFYLLNHAERFMPHGAARQYNTWLLDEAWATYERTKDMQDFVAVLAAVYRSGYPRAELEALYDRYLARVRQRDGAQFSASHLDGSKLGEECIALGKSITHDEGLRLLLTWTGEIWRYNALLHEAMVHNAKKGVAPKSIPVPPLAAADALLARYPDAAIVVWRDMVVDDTSARNWLMTETGQRDAKVALVKKHLAKVSPAARPELLHALAAYDPSVLSKKQLAMQGGPPAHLWGRILQENGIDPKAPEAEAVKQFHRLLADYESPAPKVGAVDDLLVSVTARAPSTWPMLLENEDRLWILLWVLKDRRTIHVDPYRYDPADAWKGDAWEPHLRGLVQALSEKNTIVPWVTAAWISSHKRGSPGAPGSEDALASALMQKLRAMPAYAELPHALRMAARDAFGPEADSERVAVLEKAAPRVVFAELLALEGDADVGALEIACKAVLGRLPSAPVRVAPDAQSLAKIAPGLLQDRKALSLVLEVVDNPTIRPWSYDLNPALYDAVIANLEQIPDIATIQRHAAALVSLLRSQSKKHRIDHLAKWLDDLAPVHPAMAATLARAALNLPVHGKGVPNNREKCNTILNRVNITLGIRTIAVDESDPTYPIHKSQSEFIAGNEEAAWQLFKENMDTAMAGHRSFSAEYWLWVLERLIFQRDASGQQRVAVMLRDWRQDAPRAFTSGQAAMLDILYGDIARRRGGTDDLENALKIYRTVAENPEYAGAPEVYTAILRTIDVQRLMKDYSNALQTADKLIKLRVPELWARGRYAKSEVYYDMESYDDARELVDEILAGEPNHEDAKILQGKVLIKQQSLVDATEIDIVSEAVEQQAISPGQWLSVNLTDPTLAVGGSGVDIEVDVWADSGDRETILLAPFGDSKTKFRGKARVRLGPAIQGDGILQVIGDDKVYYAYSKAFIEKVKMKDPKQGGPLTVVSDGLLMASTRTLLSVAEQKQLDAEDFAARLSGAGTSASMHVYQLIRPGNPIYVRVVDEDRSRSASIDSLSVSAEASSGDAVDTIVLTETDPYSGIFEGRIETRQAQATAFATSTRPGLNPNMVISPKAYGAWKSAPGRGKQIESLTVDLNDNVALETLTIKASEPGFGLKRFRLSAGTSRDQLDPVAFWPTRPQLADPLAPCILVAQQPEVRQIVRGNRGNVSTNFGDSPEHAYDLRTISAYLTKDYLLQGTWSEQPVSGPSDALNNTALSPFIANRRRKDSTNVACRFRAHFYEETLVTRGIAVAFDDGAPPGNGKQEGGKVPGGDRMPVYVTVNGQPLAWNGTTFSGDLELRPGLQRIEIFFQGSAKTINGGRPCTVWMRDPDTTTWTKVAADRFDPSTFPEATRTSGVGPARIEAAGTGGEWKVHFGKGARARLLVLELVEYEGPEAAINRLTLTSPGGKQVLPVPTDYQEVRKNDTLEITSGDTIWVRYEDDRFVTKAKSRHERILRAGYTNAGLAFGERTAQTLLRFRHTDRLPLLVQDSDLNVSEGADTTKVTLTTRSGSKTTVELVEGDRGLFTGWVQLGKKGTDAPAQLHTVDGDVITMSYWDQENESPGVPIQRVAQITHAVYQKPKMVISDMVVDGVVKRDGPASAPSPGGQDKKPGASGEQLLVKMRPVLIKPDGADDVTFISGLYSYIDIVAPHLRIYDDSTLTLFVQTESGRRLAAERRAAEQAARAANGAEPTAAESAPPPVFDVTVPGTRLLRAAPAEYTFANYTETRRLRTERPPLEHYSIETPNPFDSYWQKLGEGGAFRAVLGCWPGKEGAPGTAVDVNLLLRYATGGTTSPLSEEENKQLLKQLSYARKLSPHDNPELERERCKMLDLPIVKPGERVYLGFRYEDDKGQAHWLTATAKTASHGTFSAVAERDGLPRDGALLFGDRIRVHVKDLGFDTTDAPDTVQVKVSSKSGATYPLMLRESGPHSGEFTGHFKLTMRIGELSPDHDIAVLGFPATYSDMVRAVFTDSAGRALMSPLFTLGKGANGLIETFTKQYGNDDIAIRTQFALAESYLEAAKDLRKAKQEKEANVQYEIAKQLLISTMDRFTDPAAHAHAEYLLGDLTYEEAGNTEDRELRNQRYLAALARFSKVTASYPDSEDAPKAQFKRAITYERLNEPDSAAQEYVKLAYMYPDSEYLAVAMYRLGVHFRAKAGKANKEIAQLKAGIEGRDPKAIERDLSFAISQVTEEMNRQYTKAGKIFGRVVERFPNHPLKGEAALRSAQCYYAAEDYTSAVSPLKLVIDANDVDSAIRAEALYWSGKSYQRMNDSLSAYAMFVRCTEDFPETEWSGFSLAELASPQMQEFEKAFLREKKMREALR